MTGLARRARRRAAAPKSSTIVVLKKAGKVTLTSKIEIAADRKSRTTTQIGTDAQGRTVNNYIWYDKQ